jgi:hypothetical protein
MGPIAGSPPRGPRLHERPQAPSALTLPLRGSPTLRVGEGRFAGMSPRNSLSRARKRKRERAGVRASHVPPYSPFGCSFSDAELMR